MKPKPLTPEQRKFLRELARDVARFQREAAAHLDRSVGPRAKVKPLYEPSTTKHKEPARAPEELF